MKPIQVTHVSIREGIQVGANDTLIKVRVVPAGRDGNIVLGRSLMPGEADTRTSVPFYPYRGEDLSFPVGSISADIMALDALSPRDPLGYAPVANTLWTWLTVFPDPTREALFRYLFAAARRLDVAAALFTATVFDLAHLNSVQEDYVARRARNYRALGNAEQMCITFSRAIEMLRAAPEEFPDVPVTLPQAAATLESSIRAIRNAFEHIEDRALGLVNQKKLHPDALTIFQQSDFESHWILRYATHALDLKGDVYPLLMAGRAAVIQIAAHVSGAIRTFGQSITFAGAPPGDYERVKEVAFSLWERKTGRAWADPISNWHEAEAIVRGQRAAPSGGAPPPTNTDSFSFGLDVNSYTGS